MRRIDVLGIDADWEWNAKADPEEEEVDAALVWMVPSSPRALPMGKCPNIEPGKLRQADCS